LQNRQPNIFQNHISRHANRKHAITKIRSLPQPAAEGVSFEGASRLTNNKLALFKLRHQRGVV
jgi:hypothetical protein